VLTPAEKRAAQNGHPLPEDRERPPAAVIEVPEGGTVEPGA
jgi:hypothetical protein